MKHNNRFYIAAISTLMVFSSVLGMEKPSEETFDIDFLTKAIRPSEDLATLEKCRKLKSILKNPVVTTNQQKLFTNLLENLKPTPTDNIFKHNQINSLLFNIKNEDLFDNNKKELLANELNAVCQKPEESFQDIAKKSLPQDLKSLLTKEDTAQKESLKNKITQTISLMIDYIEMTSPSSVARINNLNTIKNAINNTQSNILDTDKFIQQISDIADVSLNPSSLETSAMQLSKIEMNRVRDERIQEKQKREDLEYNYLTQEKLLNAKKKNKESISLKELRNYKKALEKYNAAIPETDIKLKNEILKKIESINITIKEVRKRKSKIIEEKINTFKSRKSELTLDDLRDYEKLVKAYISYLPASKKEKHEEILKTISNHILRLTAIDEQLSAEDTNLSISGLLDKIENLLTLQKEIPNPLIKRHENISEKISTLHAVIDEKKQKTREEQEKENEKIRTQKEVDTLVNRLNDNLGDYAITKKTIPYDIFKSSAEIIKTLQENPLYTNITPSLENHIQKLKSNAHAYIRKITNQLVQYQQSLSAAKRDDNFIEAVKNLEKMAQLKESLNYFTLNGFLIEKDKQTSQINIKKITIYMDKSIDDLCDKFIQTATTASITLENIELLENIAPYASKNNQELQIKIAGTHQKLGIIAQSQATSEKPIQITRPIQTSEQPIQLTQPQKQSQEQTDPLRVIQQQLQQQQATSGQTSIQQPTIIPTGPETGPTQPQQGPGIFTQILTGIGNFFSGIANWFASWWR